MATLKEENDNPYPHKFNVTVSLEEFIERYKDVADGTIMEDTTVSVAGS